MRRFLRLALIAMPLIAVACGEDQSTTPARFEAHLYVANSTTITEQINDLFPAGDKRDAAQAKWRALQDAVAKDKPNQRMKLMHLIDWTVKSMQQGFLSDPNGSAPPTTRVAVSTLIASLFQYVYPDAPPPPIVPEGIDYGAGVVDPAATTIIVTEASQAGGEFLAGTWTQQVLVTFVEQPDPYPGGGGPLPGSYNQYPKFYQITAYPNDPTHQDIRIGICHVTDVYSPYYPAEPHGGLRVAKEVIRPEARTLQVLDRVEVADFLLCYDVEASPPEEVIGAAQMPGLGMFALRTINKAFTGMAKFVTPQPLYAIDQGIGGRLPETSDVVGEEPTGAFSLFGIVDVGSEDVGEGCGGCEVIGGDLYVDGNTHNP